jgi:LPXTG-motif cell wall-anchored protein
MKKLLFLFAAVLFALSISVAQTPSDNSAGNNGAAASQSSTTPDQNSATAPSNTTTDQNATGTADQGASQGNAAGSLPQTGSELPLLAMLGVGALGAGILDRFRKK